MTILEKPAPLARIPAGILKIIPIKGTIAPFGKGIVDYVKGGGGSGDVTTLYSRSVLDGLLQ